MASLPPSPFIPSAAIVERPAEAPTVASVVAPSDVAAECFVDFGTDCIGEIFYHARKLLAEDNRRAEDYVDWDALKAAIEEPLPLFIREDGYLRRRA